MNARIAGDCAKQHIAHKNLVSLSCGKINTVLPALDGRKGLVSIGFDLAEAGLFQHFRQLLHRIDALLMRLLRARPGIAATLEDIELVGTPVSYTHLIRI